MNWASVAFTPAGGSAVPISGVTDLTISPNGNLVKFSGDGDRFPTTTVNDYSDPQISITTGDSAALLALPPGTRGSLVATLLDARNGAGTGAITWTISPAIVQDDDFNGRHRQFAAPRIMIHTESTDGLTSPISTSIAV